jgi:putative ABC transport system permease protein
MGFWRRVGNVFRGDKLNRELDEEFEAHIAEAVADGRDTEEAKRAFGSLLRQREASREHRVAGWLDGLRADVIFGWRQLKRNKVTSAAAVLSLALAMGACVSAFRLIDALLLRPLPVSDPDHLYAITFDGFTVTGEHETWDSCSYPMFRTWRAAVKGEAELIAISYAERTDLTFGSDEEMEKAFEQHVSGWMFSGFGLQPAAGRLLTENDDLVPGKEPYAVLSYDYWTRRFGRDPKVVGRTFRIGNDLYEIVGVAEKGFIGTEPGTATDIFIPTMMSAGSINSPNSFWLRTYVRPKEGVALEPLRDKFDAMYRAFEQERAKGFANFPRKFLEGYPHEKLELKTAAEGVSGLQTDYKRSLITLGVLVLLVLLIASVNVANLMTALAAARAREMSLRVSIGAGRARLVQMVMVESAMLAMFAAGIGAFFAWWSAPFVVSMINPPDNPVRLLLPADWRVLGFGLSLIVAVTLLFGLLPALRASAVMPVNALKGGDEPHVRSRLVHGMIALQVAVCFIVVFASGLFVASFERLSHHALGFSADRVLILETVANHDQPAVAWSQAADDLASVPGVEKATLAWWPLMSGTMRNNFISVNGAAPGDVLAFFLGISPGWLETMKIPLIDGRDFRESDASPNVAVVNKTFAQQYFGGEDPVGKSFETTGAEGIRTRYEVVGLASDAVYREIREPILPVVYVPFRSVDAAGIPKAVGQGTFVVRTSGSNPAALEATLRREEDRAHPALRVSNIRTQQEIINAQTVRERLLAMLGMFFAGVALLLAGIGLYGVLNYSVLGRRREIGIRIAVGARRFSIVRLVTAEIFAALAAGSLAGIVFGLVSVRYIDALFYHVKATDPAMLAIPSLMILASALVAIAPAVTRALQMDPVEILRTE